MGTLDLGVKALSALLGNLGNFNRLMTMGAQHVKYIPNYGALSLSDPYPIQSN